MPKSIQLQAGQRFGRLTIIKLDHIKNNKGQKQNTNQEYYLCKCECGNECIVFKRSLKDERTKSCGCLQKEYYNSMKTPNNPIKTKHGDAKSILFKKWSGMKRRCYNKNDSHYKDYGGRGIIISSEWINNYSAFKKWSLANGYNEKLTIDRINNNGNYEPNNCRWIDFKQQARNKRSNINITYNNENHCVAEWANILKINAKLIYNRLSMGWTPEKALTTKVKIK